MQCLSDLDTVPSGLCLVQLSVEPVSLPPGDPDHSARGQPDPRLVSAGRVAADPTALGQGEPVAAVAADNLDTDNIDMCWRFTHFSVVTNYSTYSVDK